ncbi:MAG: DNA repair protein RecN [Eubacteriales bacterium]|nr:DNA repair protein RecN [Eubacteriales bacterium]
MLLELNVKDIALVRKASVAFEKGLNILTGETGTGKSVIIDSALLALGGKIKGDIIRRGAEYAYVELVFSPDETRAGQLKEAGFETDESGLVIISRKIMPGRSISRINDETVTLGRLKEVASLLLDVYGQNEYYTLMDKKQHLRILDEYMGDETLALRDETAKAHECYKKALSKAESFKLDEKERARETDLISFEINEIDSAGLAAGEEEELAAKYKRLNNARDIIEGLNNAYKALEGCDTGHAVSEVGHAMRFDEALKDIYSELLDAQSILESVMNDISAYADDLDVDEAEIAETGNRLDLIRRLELKYGQTIEDVLEYREIRAEKLRDMQNYDSDKLIAEKELEEARIKLAECCEKLGTKRRKGAERLSRAIITELKDLGFEKPDFGMEFSEKDPSADGSDEVWFTAALNPGEALKPLSEVASGGELSRVMLAIKTILAETDDMPTLIFDEIDTGISGRTAQKVAEKLDVIGMRHQVICVSHLPQIAAMADTHFVIRKTEIEGRNITEIEKLDEAGAYGELARLLGGAEITKAVSDNAEEMKRLAMNGKIGRRKK